jgi:hypothetical protein
MFGGRWLRMSELLLAVDAVTANKRHSAYRPRRRTPPIAGLPTVVDPFGIVEDRIRKIANDLLAFG